MKGNLDEISSREMAALEDGYAPGGRLHRRVEIESATVRAALGETPIAATPLFSLSLSCNLGSLASRFEIRASQHQTRCGFRSRPTGVRFSVMRSESEDPYQPAIGCALLHRRSSFSALLILG